MRITTERTSATIEFFQKSGLCTRNPEKSLGSFELKLIALSGKMMSNNNMDVKIILKDTIMDDLRSQTKGGITRSDELNMYIHTARARVRKK